jgi:chromosome segregation ATPase
MDILKDKRKIDKYNMELEDKISGRNVTDDMQKMKHKEEERKMRIKYEKNVASLKSQGVILMEKIANEEAKSKDVLDEKLKLEQELLDLKEDLGKLTEQHAHNRDELIKLRVKNSTLDSQNALLADEEKQLKEENEKLIAENASMEKDNADLKNKIAMTIQRIDINNLLKEIDIEEMQLLAKNNKQMNFAMENLLTKWNFIVQKNNDGR